MKTIGVIATTLGVIYVAGGVVAFALATVADDRGAGGVGGRLGFAAMWPWFAGVAALAATGVLQPTARASTSIRPGGPIQATVTPLAPTERAPTLSTTTPIGAAPATMRVAPLRR